MLFFLASIAFGFGLNEAVQFAEACEALMAANPEITTCVEDGVNSLSNMINFGATVNGQWAH